MKALSLPCKRAAFILQFGAFYWGEEGVFAIENKAVVMESADT